MTIDQIVSIATACVLSAGGVGGVVIAVVKFSSDIIASRLASKYETQLQKDLERYKNNLENKKSISKAMFDKEYDVYLTFNKELAELYNNIQLYDGLKNNGDIKTIQELMTYDVETLQELVAGGGTVTEIQMNQLEEKMSNSLMNLRKHLGYSGAFIPHDNWKLLQESCNACHQYLKSPSGDNLKSVTIYMGKMQSGLRSYLEQLTVIDGGKING